MSEMWAEMIQEKAVYRRCGGMYGVSHRQNVFGVMGRDIPYEKKAESSVPLQYSHSFDGSQVSSKIFPDIPNSVMLCEIADVLAVTGDM